MVIFNFWIIIFRFRGINGDKINILLKIGININVINILYKKKIFCRVWWKWIFFCENYLIFNKDGFFLKINDVIKLML